MLKVKTHTLFVETVVQKYLTNRYPTWIQIRNPSTPTMMTKPTVKCSKPAANTKKILENNEEKKTA
jgi:hypothetical protein